jgi:hypothetical protein
MSQLPKHPSTLPCLTTSRNFEVSQAQGDILCIVLLQQYCLLQPPQSVNLFNNLPAAKTFDISEKGRCDRFNWKMSCVEIKWSLKKLFAAIVKIVGGKNNEFKLDTSKKQITSEPTIAHQAHVEILVDMK